MNSFTRLLIKYRGGFIVFGYLFLLAGIFDEKINIIIGFLGAMLMGYSAGQLDAKQKEVKRND